MGIAWVCLALALALHVADEALTGFLPVYNSIVESVRESWWWIPLPTFGFDMWLAALVLGVLLLLGLSPLVFAGKSYMRPFAWILGILMVGNALGHMGASVYWGKPAPGVYSSPVLLTAAVFLILTTARVGRTRSPGS